MRDAEEIKQHRFFKGIDWDVVAERGLKTYKIPIPDVPASGPNVESIFCLNQGETGINVYGWSFVCN